MDSAVLDEAVAAFISDHPQSRRLREAAGDWLPCATIFDVDATAADAVFREEAWSPLLAETAIDAGTDTGFIDAAVRFCNERVFGTLSISVLVPPDAPQRLRAVLDRAIADLRYGTVSINHWSGMNFVLGIAPWGAYPGHTLDDAGSGIGVVHNTLMFEQPLKTVVWGPFTTWPKPPWFITHRRGHTVGRRIAAFEAAPSASRLAQVAIAALRP
jgi:aldehyde dehydrogenase (NAD(P)+)